MSKKFKYFVKLSDLILSIQEEKISNLTTMRQKLLDNYNIS